MSAGDIAMRLAEAGRIPDVAVRLVIRRQIRQRLREEARHPLRRQELLAELRAGSISRESGPANELPQAFFEAVLGPRMKYSACYWSEDVEDLGAAELAMLELVGERARLADGLSILDLGCGWGSFSLWAAQRYPSSEITAVSNSASQKAYIDRRAVELGIDNVTTHAADVSDFKPESVFDRVISVELFEHLRNYESLLERINKWLTPDGHLFVHVFCHRKLMYRFDDDGPGNWMRREFLAGGIMPAADTLPEFQGDLRLERQWHLNGRHYRDTARAWLDNLDRNRALAAGALATRSADLPGGGVDREVQRWRMFLMACEELFGYSNCTEWEVCHYLFTPRVEPPGDGDPV